MDKENRKSRSHTQRYGKCHEIKEIIGEHVESKPFQREMQALFNDYLSYDDGRNKIFSLIDEHKTYWIGRLVKNNVSFVVWTFISALMASYVTLKMQDLYDTNEVANISNPPSSVITENSSK